VIFLAIFGRKRVNCDEMDGDRPRLPANRNCYRLSRVSWALAQISCLKPCTQRLRICSLWLSSCTELRAQCTVQLV